MSKVKNYFVLGLAKLWVGLNRVPKRLVMALHLQQVNEFRYLESLTTDDNKTSKKI